MTDTLRADQTNTYELVLFLPHINADYEVVNIEKLEKRYGTEVTKRLRAFINTVPAAHTSPTARYGQEFKPRGRQEWDSVAVQPLIRKNPLQKILKRATDSLKRYE